MVKRLALSLGSGVEKTAATRKTHAAADDVSLGSGVEKTTTRPRAATDDDSVVWRERRQQHEVDLKVPADAETKEDNIVLRDPSHWMEGYRQFLRQVN
jgi:hypothetical protein